MQKEGVGEGVEGGRGEGVEARRVWKWREEMGEELEEVSGRGCKLRERAKGGCRRRSGRGKGGRSGRGKGGKEWKRGGSGR